MPEWGGGARNFLGGVFDRINKIYRIGEIRGKLFQDKRPVFIWDLRGYKTTRSSNEEEKS
jgi:hypothetical protein